jgi:hypothetical protein
LSARTVADPNNATSSEEEEEEAGFIAESQIGMLDL